MLIKSSAPSSGCQVVALTNREVEFAVLKPRNPSAFLHIRFPRLKVYEVFELYFLVICHVVTIGTNFTTCRLINILKACISISVLIEYSMFWLCFCFVRCVAEVLREAGWSLSLFWSCCCLHSHTCSEFGLISTCSSTLITSLLAAWWFSVSRRVM